MQISIVTPYYGPLPIWLPLFLQSVAYNQRIRVFIVTDQEINYQLPPNVSCVRISLSEIESRARRLVSADFQISYGYKLCDLRPLFGLVFEDLLQGCDLWGYCDLDLIFGTLSPLLDSDRLEDADFFSADAGTVVGTFCLYRNTERMNTFAMNISGFVTKLCSREYMSLDEKELAKMLETTKGGIRYVRAAKLNESQLSISADGRMVGRTAGVLGEPNEFFWVDGHAFVKSPGIQSQEVMYLHFIGLKRWYHWTAYIPTETYREFSFTAAGFRPWRTAPTPAAAIRSTAKGMALQSLSAGRSQVAKYMSTSTRHKLKRALRTMAIVR